MRNVWKRTVQELAMWDEQSKSSWYEMICASGIIYATDRMNVHENQQWSWMRKCVLNWATVYDLTKCEDMNIKLWI